MGIFDRDLWQEILHTLSKNKWRTVLTALGVFWGIFMLIIMLGSGKGLQNGVQSDFSGFATNSLYLWARSTSKPYAGLPIGRRIRLNNEDYDALKEIKEFAVVSPRNQLGGYRGGNNVTRLDRTSAFDVMGDFPQIRKVMSMDIIRGRFINELDILEKRKIAVIGTRAVQVLFDRGENPIGKNIRINGVYFTVIGTFKTWRSGREAEKDAQTIFIPFSTFQAAFNSGNRVHWFAMLAAEDVKASEAEEKAIAIIKERHKIDPTDERALGHFNAQEEFDKMNGLFGAISWLTWFVGGGTLLAGIIGVSNILLIVVKERTREIGIRRAVGATPFAIQRQIVLESIFLTIISGYIGLVVGVGLLELLSSYVDAPMFRRPEIDFEVAVRALIILSIAGVIAGFLPAIRATSIKPVDALRAK
jgi:putative ABC transport system permease protein